MRVDRMCLSAQFLSTKRKHYYVIKAENNFHVVSLPHVKPNKKKIII